MTDDWNLACSACGYALVFCQCLDAGKLLTELAGHICDESCFGVDPMKEDNMSYELEFTVLGLLGPAGSGKDLVADYLQKKNFVKIAFADPMKRFAKKAFNLSNEQLWGESYQRNGEFFVDEAWWMEVIGHFGPASQELINEVLEVGTRTEGYLKLHDWLSRLRMDYREKISPRVILQTLGTEWGRSVDPLMWIRYAYQCVGLWGLPGVVVRMSCSRKMRGGMQ